MFRVLESRCAKCGRRETENVKLQFHVKDPAIGDKGCDWHHRVETERRAVYYRHMLLQNNLELLCDVCHAEISKGQLYWREISVFKQPELGIEQPF